MCKKCKKPIQLASATDIEQTLNIKIEEDIINDAIEQYKLGMPVIVYYYKNNLFGISIRQFRDMVKKKMGEEEFQKYFDLNIKPNMPSIKVQIRNAQLAAARFFKKNGKRFVDEREYNRRLDICNECPNNVQGRCSECGCFLKFKIKMASEICPLKYWTEWTEPIYEIV